MENCGTKIRKKHDENKKKMFNFTGQTSISFIFLVFQRRERDSNSRYSFPYDSLANCWFQPLTHLSI